MRQSILLQVTFAFVLCKKTALAFSTSSKVVRIEDSLAKVAESLEESINPTQQLLETGVCRINNVISAKKCATLKNQILHILDTHDARLDDVRTIPQTRLRFSQAWNVPLNQRDDLLLPVEDETIGNLLQELAQTVGPILQSAACELLPPRTESSNKKTHYAVTNKDLELVEVGCLVSHPGATHQVIHADFHRHVHAGVNANNKPDRLPPRLVTFLYLQDTPTVQHGPTIFLPHTNNEHSHSAFYKKDHRTNNCPEENSDCQAQLFTQPILAATLTTGDCAIYGASLLHFGSANSVPDNTRAVLYFGVSLLDVDDSSGQEEEEKEASTPHPQTTTTTTLENLPPIRLVTPTNGKARFCHADLYGLR